MFGTYSWKIHIKTETIDILCDLMSFANFIKVLGYFNLTGFAYKNKPYKVLIFAYQTNYEELSSSYSVSLSHSRSLSSLSSLLFDLYYKF